MNVPDTTALAPLANRLEVREDVELVVQTKTQRRISFAIVLGGVALISFATVGGQMVYPVLAGVAMGLGSSKTRTLGRARLRYWVERLERPEQRAQALARLEWLATRAAAVTSVRVEAAAHVVLDRIERGALDEAVAVMSRAYRDFGKAKRHRLADQGFLGEAVAALLGRLVPGSMADVVAAARIVSSHASGLRSHADFELVLGLVRALEAGASGSQTSALTAWRDANSQSRAAQHPVLMTLVTASLHALFDDNEELGSEILRRVEALDEDGRAAILRRFPRVAELGRQDYRSPAPDQQTTTALVPVDLQGLSTGPAPTRWLPAVNRRSRWVAAIAVGAFLLNAVVTLGTGTLATVALQLLGALVFSPAAFSAPVLRRRRREVLERAGVLRGDDDPRREELARMPARGGPSRGDGASLHPLDLHELRVVVGLHQAELELAEGRVEQARAWIGWWLESATEQGFGEVSPLAIGASALRVAALTGHAEAAAALDAALAKGPSEDPRVPKRPKLRSGHGDGERAVILARALARSLEGNWDEAHELLRRSPGESIELDDHERARYGELARGLAERGLEPPAWLAQ